MPEPVAPGAIALIEEAEASLALTIAGVVAGLALKLPAAAWQRAAENPALCPDHRVLVTAIADFRRALAGERPAKAAGQ